MFQRMIPNYEVIFLSLVILSMPRDILNRVGGNDAFWKKIKTSAKQINSELKTFNVEGDLLAFVKKGKDCSQIVKLELKVLQEALN